MVRKRAGLHPELESLERMVLLSGLAAGEHAGGAAIVAAEARPDGVIVLTGTAKGTYKTPGLGSPTSFSEKGTLSPIGKVTLKGSINYYSLHPTGTVTISSATRKHGKITASVSTAGPDDPVYYEITGASGIYSGDTGSGVALVATVPAKGNGSHGKVTLTFEPGVS